MRSHEIFRSQLCQKRSVDLFAKEGAVVYHQKIQFVIWYDSNPCFTNPRQMLHHFKHRWDGFGPPSWAAPKTPGYSMTLWFVKNAWLYNITHRLYRCVSLCRGFGFSICDGSSHRHPFLSPIGQLEPLTGGAAGHLNDADYWYFRKFVTTFLNFGRNFPSPFFLSSCHFGPSGFGGLKEGFHADSATRQVLEDHLEGGG